MKIISGIRKYFNFSSEKLVLFFVHKNKKKKLNKIKTNIIQVNRGLHLKNVFSCEEKYNYIIQLLIDQKLISKETHIWADFSNGSKKLVIVILKLLPILGYYKDNKILTNKEILEIAFNTFGVKLSKGYVEHTKFNDLIVDFIPYANQVNKERK